MLNICKTFFLRLQEAEYMLTNNTTLEEMMLNARLINLFEHKSFRMWHLPQVVWDYYIWDTWNEVILEDNFWMGVWRTWPKNFRIGAIPQVVAKFSVILGVRQISPIICSQLDCSVYLSAFKKYQQPLWTCKQAFQLELNVKSLSK